MPIKTVLIIDRELGFVFWLGQALDRAGYQALPAKSCEDAAELLKQLNVEIHLLIIGQSLAGACAFADALRLSQGHLKVIAVIGEGEERSSEFPGADATQFMLSAVDEASEREWLKTIEDMFSQDDATGANA
jgi:DNA-binding NtrC family response regulator